MSRIPRRQRRRLAVATALGVTLLAAAAVLHWVDTPLFAGPDRTAAGDRDGENGTGPPPCDAPCLQTSPVRLGEAQVAAWSARAEGFVIHDVVGRDGHLAAAASWEEGHGILWWDHPLDEPRLVATLDEPPADLRIEGTASVWSSASGIAMWRPGMEEPLPRAPGLLRLLAVEGRTALVHCRTTDEAPEPQVAFCTVDIEEGGIHAIEATRTPVDPGTVQEAPWPAGGLHAGTAWTVWSDGTSWSIVRFPLEDPERRTEVHTAAAPIGRLAVDEDQVVWHVAPADGPAQVFVHHPYDDTMHPVETPVGVSSRDPSAADDWVVATTRTPGGTEELWTLDGLGRLDTMLLRVGDTHPVEGRVWTVAATAGAGAHVLAALADPGTGAVGAIVVLELPPPPEEQLS